ncbi:MAG TPA: DUF805 domain-containing protein [Acetobacteraceae bacterium]|jgi:uncharacterized membrane protein YhaH (DUF805 family)|nr:DUF805 domain-containing protein [Acetobacteraceae bacterium]
MSFGQAVSACFGKYVTFSGRAIRSEYWYWALFLLIVGLILGAIDWTLPYHFLLAFFDLATILPGLAVMVRRLHDLDRSGWWWLILFVPLVGPILLIVWMCTRGTPGPNRFGPASA